MLHLSLSLSLSCPYFLLSPDIRFNRESCMILAEEISRSVESLSFSVLLLRDDSDDICGEAVVDLWIMIEDSINIARQVNSSSSSVVVVLVVVLVVVPLVLLPACTTIVVYCVHLCTSEHAYLCVDHKQRGGPSYQFCQHYIIRSNKM